MFTIGAQRYERPVYRDAAKELKLIERSTELQVLQYGAKKYMFTIFYIMMINYQPDSYQLRSLH